MTEKELAELRRIHDLPDDPSAAQLVEAEQDLAAQIREGETILRARERDRQAAIVDEDRDALHDATAAIAEVTSVVADLMGVRAALRMELAERGDA
jgi:hypothetical protein